MGTPDNDVTKLKGYEVAEVQQALWLLPRDTREKFLGLLAAGGALADELVISPDDGSGEIQEVDEVLQGSFLNGVAQRLGVENPESDEARAALRQRIANFGIAASEIYPEDLR